MVITSVDQGTKPEIKPATTTKIVLILEYNGTRYSGFQFQADRPTIQSEIEKAITKLTGEELRVIAASRTDTGVHAKGQVISFRTHSNHSLQTFINGLNYYLPEDIAVQAAHRVDDTFNVRKDAVSREYKYFILNSLTRSPLRNSFAYQLGGELDVRAMNRASQSLVGLHDFASFTNGIEDGASTMRRVYDASVTKEGDLIVFNILASSFLAHQVRNTVGALIKVGAGKMNENEFFNIVEAKKPGLAGPTAPACGLCLMQVNYPQSFEEEI